MEELRNLQKIYSLAAGRFNQYEGKDFVLPEVFKQQVKEINSNKIIYNDYSAVIETKGTQNGVLNIYLPNQWFYIASYFTDFYNELQKYKKEALKVVSKERLKDLNGQSLTDEEMRRVNQLNLDDNSKGFLIRFMTDYSWWYGAKTIDRGDFYVSPILNSARLVNASQSFVAELCAYLADKKDLVDVIISGEENSTIVAKKELLRQKAAATFMKKAMHITQERDNNFSKIEALDVYKETGAHLIINKFYFGRRKDKLPKDIDDVDISVNWTYNNKDYVLYVEWSQNAMEESFFPAFNKAYSGSLQMQKEQNGEYVLYEVISNKLLIKDISSCPLQQIFYGAPGTGKSNTIKREVDDKGKLNFRVTFHPDSDYSTFVGCYKPTMVKVPKTTLIGTKLVEVENGKPEEKIIYRFVPQAFAKAYTTAWKTKEDVYLIIEEINRGNCAQIFGDLFQLLDRGDDGFSEYPVDADTDLGSYIAKELADSSREDFPDGVKDGKKLMLPKNLYIWATMNTSDQSLFPIDSAFKRRWDWVYMPIDTKKDNWFIKVGEKRYSWTDFLEKINNEILTDETAEDKHLGFYFCKAENTEIAQETFVGKVLFYLWNDVFKVYGIPSQLGSSKEWAYTKFYNTDGKVNEQKVIDLMKKLNIAPEGGDKDAEVKADENPEENTDEQ